MAAELPVRHLMVGEEQMKRLEKDVWSDKFVSCQLAGSRGRANAKVRYRGGHTRSYSKRSYEVVCGGKTYHYNAEFDDPSLIRNALSFQFFEWIGVPSPKTRHVQLLLNGRSLGVYLELEGVEKPFFRKRGIAVESLFYAVNDHANFGLTAAGSSRRKTSLFDGYQQMIGTGADRRRLVLFVRRLNGKGASASKELHGYLTRRLDIDNYLRWLAGAVLTGNYDGFDQNYAVYRHKPTGKYRIIPWDYEGTWGRNCYGKACGSDLVRIKGYNRLTGRLMQYGSVRRQYKALLQRLLRTSFTEQRILPVVKSMHESIRPYVYRDTERKWTFSTFEGEPEFIRHYIEERRRLIAEGLREL
ncbi:MULTISPECIES: CotH kinase family protein [Paenibacillus]|uniref:CotH kinase family protein n=1 Tax=Paenibacillus TaxID=44249 RepID=UPI0022B88157|nr:CotH kinase family protein [Paenibacillus caseinilyticus]MCZ8519042.1 CotH kinase family protein [Paenibacillus caseinilyticus]